MAFIINKASQAPKVLYLAAAVLIVGLIFLIAGAALIANCGGSKASDNAKAPTAKKLKSLSQFCEYSPEAERMGLNKFLKKVQRAYFENSPHQVAFDPDVKAGDMHEYLKKRYVCKLTFSSMEHESHQLCVC